LLALHGGTVEAASAGLGQGAEFTIHLPSSVLVQHRGREVIDRFRRAIRPIYRPHGRRKGLYEQIGTATLFKVNSAPLIVTAAHVIDHHKQDGDLWVGAEKTLVPLQGSFSSTERPGGNRKLDEVGTMSCKSRTALIVCRDSCEAFLGRLPQVSW
jgi:hypothetical protein